MSMDLTDIRNKIDGIDDEITELFAKRMQLAKEVAEYKKANNLPVLNSGREREIISRVTGNVPEELSEYTKMLFSTMFDFSRGYQEELLFGEKEVTSVISDAIDKTPKLFPKGATVACQGIEGANSTSACEKLFGYPAITYTQTFEGVFLAVEKGLCKYGILPIENSLHGSVTEVFDLMKQYNFFITRSVKVKIEHTLLGKKNVDITKIKEVYSHPQALAQCSEFLKTLNGVKVIECKNTAVAAEFVANSDRDDIAAIASESCSELYGLHVIKTDIQNSDNNHTRFICISKELEIYPGANKISLMFTIPHKPGALYNIISKFSFLGVNLTKIESRPIKGKDFEFMFYIELDADVNDPCVDKLLSSLKRSADKLTFLGSYGEV